MDLRFLLYFIVPTVLGVIIFIAGVSLMLIAARREKKLGFVDIETWDTAGGKVLSARIEQHEAPPSNKDSETIDQIYEPIVEYAYFVGDTEYHGSKVFPGDSEKLKKDQAQKIIDEYPLNTYVPVRYNPEEPSKSALMPAPKRQDFIQMGGWLFTGFGISVCCFTGLMSIIILGAIQ